MAVSSTLGVSLKTVLTVRWMVWRRGRAASASGNRSPGPGSPAARSSDWTRCQAGLSSVRKLGGQMSKCVTDLRVAGGAHAWAHHMSLHLFFVLVG